MITIPLKGDVGKLFKKAQVKAEEAGIELSGNKDSGSFNGKGVKGSYTVDNGNLEVSISKKPFYITESRLKSEFSEMFS